MIIYIIDEKVRYKLYPETDIFKLRIIHIKEKLAQELRMHKTMIELYKDNIQINDYQYVVQFIENYDDLITFNIVINQKKRFPNGIFQNRLKSSIIQTQIKRQLSNHNYNSQLAVTSSDLQNVMKETAYQNIATQYFIHKLNGPEGRYIIDNIRLEVVEPYENFKQFDTLDTIQSNILPQQNEPQEQKSLNKNLEPDETTVSIDIESINDESVFEIIDINLSMHESIS